MSNVSPERFDPSMQFGFEYSLRHYLAYNPQDTRNAYVISARKQADLLTIPPNGTVVELACGTGNSGLAFLENAKESIKRFVAFDRSDNSTIAGRRFNQVSESDWIARLANILNIPRDVLDNIEDSRQRKQQLGIQALVTRARVQEIPLPSGFADGMFCVQGFHWLLFADEDTSGIDLSYVLTSLKEMRRVLKPGAELVFDTHGGAIDFGNHMMNGQLLNNLHFNRHPAHSAFVEALNKELRNAGFKTQIIAERPNKYHGRLNERLVSELLSQAGFKSIPLTNHSTYSIEPIEIDINRFIQSRRHGGQMVYFTDPEVSGLSEDKKLALLSRAADCLTPQQLVTFSQIPAYEFLVFFKAKAV